jgi:hypothetical protein
MFLSFFAYIDESKDPTYPQSNVMTTHNPVPRGERVHRNTENGGYDLVGLDAITYEDEADLHSQVHAILKELD